MTYMTLAGFLAAGLGILISMGLLTIATYFDDCCAR